MKLEDFQERMQVWFTPNMIFSTEALLSWLTDLAKEYDTGNLTVGKVDEIFAISDKIQAELWRRHLHE